jgi:hypothetical protein
MVVEATAPARLYHVDLDELVARFPRIWHATFPGGWDSISQSGLRTSMELLTNAGRGDEATSMRSEIAHVATEGGDAVLRSQVPNRVDPEPYLDGITVADWWVLLNSRSYFFADQDALEKLVQSCAEDGTGQEVISFETRRLLAPVAEHVEVATVSVGVFPRTSGPCRGRSTFQSLSDFSGDTAKIKEITVTTPVAIVDSAVIKVVRFTPNQDPVRIWPPVQPQQEP